MTLKSMQVYTFVSNFDERAAAFTINDDNTYRIADFTMYLKHITIYII